MASYDQRYRNGEHELVWREIYRLGEEAFAPSRFEDISAVVRETMLRVRFNVDLLYQKLLDSGYKFHDDIDMPRSLPDENTESQLALIETSIKSMGCLPLTVKEYYRMVGGVNFIWDYDNFPEDMWFDYADPLYVISLSDLVEDTCTDEWAEEMAYATGDGYVPSAYLMLAPDYFHKDAVSGGPAYGIEICQSPSIDSRVLFEENEGTFIDYLRRAFEWGGFPRVALENSGFEEKIAYLKKGLKAI